MRYFILILVIGLVGCYDINRETYALTSLPPGNGENADMVIIRQEHFSEDWTEITRRIDGEFDRVDILHNQTLVEIDTVSRYDVLRLSINTSGELQTKIYASVYRSDTILETLWYRINIKNKKVTKEIVID